MSTWKSTRHSNNKRVPRVSLIDNTGKKANTDENPTLSKNTPSTKGNRYTIPYLAGVDVGHQLSLSLARISPLSKKDDPRLVHVRHGAAKVRARLDSSLFKSAVMRRLRHGQAVCVRDETPGMGWDGMG